MSTPILNPMLSVTGAQQIDRPSAQLDWYLLQKFLGSNIATLGIDPSGAGADPTGNIDATAAIQHILDTSVNQNQMVALFIRPNSIYKISAPLILPDNKLVYIYGGGILKLADGANCDMIQSAAAPLAFYIHDIIFLGSAGSLSAIKLEFGVDSLILGCSFFSWDAAGVHVIPSTGHSFIGLGISNNFFSANGTDIALNATNGTVDMVRIEGNTFDSVTSLTTAPLYPATGYPGFSTRGNAGLTTTKIYDSNFFWQPPQALAYQSGGQVIATGVQTTLTFGVGFDREGVWVVGLPTRFTAPVDGTYLATAQVSYSVVPTSAAFSVIGVTLNGAFTTPIVAASNQLQHTIQVTAPLLMLTGGDYIEFVVLHNAVGNATTLANSTFGSLQLQRIP